MKLLRKEVMSKQAAQNLTVIGVVAVTMTIGAATIGKFIGTKAKELKIRRQFTKEMAS
jgi:hypothetical protein